MRTGRAGRRALLSSVAVCAAGLLTAVPVDASAASAGWVVAHVDRTGTVTSDGLVQVDVTYRCRVPGDGVGSTEVYRVLTQHPGTSRQVSDDGYDVDEFSCDGSRTTVTHVFSAETGRFHPGRARLVLEIRICTGDVTDDPGTCVSRVVGADVRLRPLR